MFKPITKNIALNNLVSLVLVVTVIYSFGATSALLSTEIGAEQVCPFLKLL
jgi:hypothetical protein